jgi:hypothetical protein
LCTWCRTGQVRQIAQAGVDNGLARDARFDMDGFKNTLRLRAELVGGDANTAPAKYLDLSYYERALAGMP